MFSNDPQKTRLAELISASGALDDATKFDNVLLGHESGHLVGHVMLDMLEERGLPADEFDAVGARPAELGLALSIMHAASSRGMDINTIVLDDDAVRGPYAAGDRVVLVSLRDGQMHSGAAAGEPVVFAGIEVAALASLIGSGDLAVFTDEDLA